MTKLYEDNRPKTKEEIIGQDAAVEKFFGLLDNGLVRDFLFSGPSGCGKTTTARVAVTYLWPSEHEGRYHEFNASDDRGLPFVRNQIKELAQFSYPKIIVLDEADSMTKDAYEALRKTVEGSTSTYFILCVNDDSLVLPAIISRCKLIKFRPLADEDVWTVMMNVLDNQGIEYDVEEEKVKQMFEHIAIIADGDLRIAIQELAGYIKVDDNKWSLNLDRPLEGAPNITYLESAIQLAVEGKLQEAINRVEDALIVDRIVPNRAVKQAYEYIKTLDDMASKAEMLYKLAELDKSLRTSYPLIQYVGFLAYVWLVGSMTKKVAA